MPIGFSYKNPPRLQKTEWDKDEVALKTQTTTCSYLAGWGRKLRRRACFQCSCDAKTGSAFLKT
jgi:hypothetical protein